MTPEMLFEYLAVHINGQKAKDEKSVFNIDLDNAGDQYQLKPENGVRTIPLGQKSNRHMPQYPQPQHTEQHYSEESDAETGFG